MALRDVADGDRRDAAQPPEPRRRGLRERRPHQRHGKQVEQRAAQVRVPLGDVAAEVDAELEALRLDRVQRALDELLELVVGAQQRARLARPGSSRRRASCGGRAPPRAATRSSRPSGTRRSRRGCRRATWRMPGEALVAQIGVGADDLGRRKRVAATPRDGRRRSVPSSAGALRLDDEQVRVVGHDAEQDGPDESLHLHRIVTRSHERIGLRADRRSGSRACRADNPSARRSARRARRGRRRRHSSRECRARRGRGRSRSSP